MSESMIHPAERVHGLRAMELSNDSLRVVVLPEAGAKIWQIHYMPTAADVLWNNPRCSRAASRSMHRMTIPGAVDGMSCFPTMQPANGMDTTCPITVNYGRASGSPTCACTKCAVAPASYHTPLTHFQVEKTIVLQAKQPAVVIDYKLTNKGNEDSHFSSSCILLLLFPQHHRIDFPAMMIDREPEFPGTLQDAPLTFPWPHAHLGSRTIDLRQVPDEKSGCGALLLWLRTQRRLVRSHESRQGLGAALRFDRRRFHELLAICDARRLA